MGRFGEVRLHTTPLATTHVLSPIDALLGIVGYADPYGGLLAMERSWEEKCSAQRFTAPPAADPTGAAGRGPRRKLPSRT